jgi:hypothetical protein
MKLPASADCRAPPSHNTIYLVGMLRAEERSKNILHVAVGPYFIFLRLFFLCLLSPLEFDSEIVK